MKKSIPVVLIVLVALTATLLAGCGNSAPTPGTAWANSEVFTYTVKDADRDNAQIATMTITTERLSAGTYRIGAIDRDFTVSSTQSQGGGLRVKTSAVAPDGTVLMESESLLNGFTALASYKKVANGDVNYETRAYYDGKNYHYQSGSAEWQSVKIKSGFLDNELLYMVLRCYSEIDSAYSATYNIPNPLNGVVEKIAVSVVGTEQSSYTVKYIDLEDKEVEAAKPVTVLSLSKSESPVGTSIGVWYTKSDFALPGVGGKTASYHIPVKIVENNLTYELVTVKIR